MRALLGRDVKVTNDANCLALSEAIDGAGQGYELVFAAILGTGCGAGVACRGTPLIGPNGLAGEGGHNPLPGPAQRGRRARPATPGGPGGREASYSCSGRALH